MGVAGEVVIDNAFAVPLAPVEHMRWNDLPLDCCLHKLDAGLTEWVDLIGQADVA